MNKYTFSRKHPLYVPFLYTVLVVCSVLLLMPLFYLLGTSFKTLAEVLGPLKWLPESASFTNFHDVLTMENFHLLRFFSNTMFIFMMRSIGTILSCSLAAYGFTRYHFKYKELIFAIMLSVFMLPGELLGIPIFEAFLGLGWHDTYKPLYVPAFFATDVFMLFLFRQFFVSIPNELFNAAKIDGATEFQLYSRIMLPLCKPVIATCLLLYFTGTYNDIYMPSLYISSEEKFTVSQGVRYIEGLFDTGSRDFIVPWNIVSAATLLAILPILALFFIAQKQFVEGLASTGIKG